MGRREVLVVLLGMVALSALWFVKAWASPTRLHPGTAGDFDHFLWYLSWVPHAIGHGMNPLISNAVGYPHGVNLMWNASMPLVALAISPITITAGPVVAYNVVLTLAPALSGWCAYIAFRRWTGPGSALAGSLVFAFSPFVATHTLSGHANLTLLASAPLMLILLDRLFVRRDRPAWRIGLWLGLLAAAQLLVAEEVLVLEAIAAAVGTAVLALSRPALVRSSVPYVAQGLLTALGVFCVVDAWPLAVQFLGPARVTLPVQPPGLWVGDVYGFVVPTDVMQFTTHGAVQLASHLPGNSEERTAYLGLPLLVLVIATALIVRRLVALVALAILAAAVLLSLGPSLSVKGHTTSIWLPWRLVQDLPALRDTLPIRFSVIVGLMAGLLLALLLDSLRGRARWAKLAGWSLAGLSLVALLPRLPSPVVAVDAPSAFRDRAVCRLTGKAQPALLALPLNSQLPELWQEEADFCFRTPAGDFLFGDTSQYGRYRLDVEGTSPVPPLGEVSATIEGGGPAPAVNPDIRRAVLAELASPAVDAIAVGPTNNQEQLVHWLTLVLGEPSRTVGNTSIWILRGR